MSKKRFIISAIITFLIMVGYAVLSINIESDVPSNIVETLSFLPLSFTIMTFIVFIREQLFAYGCSKSKAQKGAKFIAEQIEHYEPSNVIYVDGNSQKLFCNLVKKYLNWDTYQDVKLAKIDKVSGTIISPLSHNIISTKKFNLYFPKKVFKSTDKILILDDVVKTGDTISNIENYLIKNCGVKKENILSIAFIVDSNALTNSALPAIFFEKTQYIRDDYKFPWRG